MKIYREIRIDIDIACLQKQAVPLQKHDERVQAKVLAAINDKVEKLKAEIQVLSLLSEPAGGLSQSAKHNVNERIQEMISCRNALGLKVCPENFLDSKERVLNALDEATWALQSLVAAE